MYDYSAYTASPLRGTATQQGGVTLYLPVFVYQQLNTKHKFIYLALFSLKNKAIPIMPSSHDLFVKGFLSNLNEAIDFFDGSLPKSITNLLDLEKLELTKETFIGKDHDESRTDLLYKVPLHLCFPSRRKGLCKKN